MARPLRIEYENAFYHIMNRGKGRQLIFHGDQYYAAFLQGLEEACIRFGVEIHAYCLMGNHYHLLLSTPRGNVSRVMRHINGVYTQRYNQLRKTDGPLFRGRYKAILVDADSYLLQLSRYIHRNPVEARTPLVKRLDDYRWSSYPAYVGKVVAPAWLIQDTIHEELDAVRTKAAYRRFVEQGLDEETTRFYGKAQQPAIWGDKIFAETACAKATSKDREVTKRGVIEPVSIQKIVKQVAYHFDCSKSSIYKARRGRGAPNIPRWIAMKLSQDHSGRTLAEIARLFGVGNYCTVSQTVSRLNRLVLKDKVVSEQLNTISKDLTP